MKEDKIYKNLSKKLDEISFIEPQSLGPLTYSYKAIVPFFKNRPWRVFVLGSFLLSFFLYLLFGASIVYLVSVLQYGF